MKYIYIALILYILSIGTGLAGQTLIATAAGVSFIVLVGYVLVKIYRVIDDIKRLAWERVAPIWIGAEYSAAISIYVITGVGFRLSLYFAAGYLARLAPTSEMPMTELMGVSILLFGAILLGIVGLVAWVYLVEVMTRDLYLLQVTLNQISRKPHSATLYVVLGAITLGFLYFYWLYYIWKWAIQLKTSTKLPP